MERTEQSVDCKNQEFDGVFIKIEPDITDIKEVTEDEFDASTFCDVHIKEEMVFSDGWKSWNKNGNALHAESSDATHSVIGGLEAQRLECMDSAITNFCHTVHADSSHKMSKPTTRVMKKKTYKVSELADLDIDELSSLSETDSFSTSDDGDSDYNPDRDDKAKEDAKQKSTEPSSSNKRSNKQSSKSKRAKKEEDDEIRKWIPVDPNGANQKSFAYSGPINFENFPPGPYTPSSVFTFFCNDAVMDLIVETTNQIAESRQKPGKKGENPWKPISAPELKRFLGLVMYFGLVPYPKISLYWSLDKKYKNSFVRQVMARNRFQEILRYIHFSHEILYPTDRLKKVKDLVDLLNENFKQFGNPGENVVIDETMVPFRGRLLFKQYLPARSSKYGLKLYKICSPQGYTFSVKIYAGKEEKRNDTEIRKTDEVVQELMSGFKNQGRTLTVDNFYTNIDLAASLLQQSTHLVGTLRKCTKGVPKEILLAKKLKKGEILGVETEHGIVVGTWNDKRPVRFLTTKHTLKIEETGKKNRKGEEVRKPEAIIAYNKNKQGVDLSDQMSSYFSPLRKTIRWFHKVSFFLLLGTAVVNAWLLYKQLTSSKIQIVEFREMIIDDFCRKLNEGDGAKQSALKLHELNKNTQRDATNRIIRGRCSNCYNLLKKHLDRKVAQAKAPKVATKCLTCPGQPFSCLECFNKFHKK